MLFKLSFLAAYILTILALHPVNKQKRHVGDINYCVFRNGNITVDFKKLFRPNGYEVKEGNRVFLLNICGVVSQCATESAKDVSACEINDKIKNITVLGLLSTIQDIKIFHPNFGLRYKYVNHNKKKNIEIKFVCNRRVRDYDISFVPPKGENGAKHLFVFQSNIFCFKEPLNCLFKEEISELEYNLQPLYNKNSDYKIMFESTTIILNICGNIVSSLTGECEDKRTQICMLDKKGNYKNLGTFSDKGIEYQDNYITVIYSDGSPCSTDRYIKTQIDFKCSDQEKPPAIISSSLCQYHIIWETKHACPHYTITHHNCEFNNYLFENRNFKTIFKNTTEVELQDAVLYYNICDTVKSCNGDKNASVCLVERNVEKIYGWQNSDITYKDGDLTMQFFGDKCNSKFNYKTMINFICSYVDDIQVNYTACMMHINFYTKFACPLMEIKGNNCSLTVDQTLYDINILKLLNKNYVVRDTNDKNIEYIINICHPIVFNSEAMCDGYSSVCRKNISEPDIRRRFVSLGSYNEELLKLSLIDEKIVLTYLDGSLTHDLKRYSTEIHLICTTDEKVQNLQLNYHDNNKFIFEWRTKHACPNNTRNSLPYVNKLNDILVTTELIIRSDETNKDSSTIDKKIEKKKDLNKKKSNTSNNCIIIDKIQGTRLNLTYIPQNIKAISKKGKNYSIHICGSTDESNCRSIICGGEKYRVPYANKDKVFFDTDLKLSFIQLNSSGNVRCNEGYYNSVIFMKCSEQQQNPSIIKEDECSVHFEWYNNATCDILKVNKENKLKLSGGSIAAISTVIIFLLISIVVFIFYGVRKNIFRKCLQRDKSVIRVYYEKDTLL